MAKIYIASALFTKKEKERIDDITKQLRKLGHTVYSPKEFHVPNANEMPNADWAKAVFDIDLKHLDEANVVLYICEGMNGDIGAAWECGYAYAKNKSVVVVETGDSSTISLMVAQSARNKNNIKGYQS